MVCIVNEFFRARLSAYVIKNVAITDKQDKEHLAQTQRKKWRRRDETRPTTRTTKRDATKASLAQIQEAAPRDLSRLLTTSNTTKKSLYNFALGKSEGSTWHTEASTERSRSDEAETGGSVAVKRMQGTRPRMNQTPPQNLLAREAMMRNQQLGVDGPSATLHC
jgi:hypothetical protein